MTPYDDLDVLDDPSMAVAAEALAVGAVRFHPSPRFEERLALRLRAAAAGTAVLAPVARAIAPAARPVELAPAVGLASAGGLVGLGHAVERVPRPVLVGGAIASGVSLAGAAVVVWARLRRSS